MAHHEQDEGGQWWYVFAVSEKGVRGGRVRVWEKTCEGCSKVFLPRSRRQLARFCGRTCAMRATGSIRGRKGELSGKWKGGRRYQNGYVQISTPDHPYATTAGYVHEHRLVMEEALGRYLDPGEVVHHINFDKADNRLENLELFPSQAEHMQNRHRLSREIPHCPTCTCEAHA